MVHELGHDSKPLNVVVPGMVVKREPGRKAAERMIHKVLGLGFMGHYNVHNPSLDNVFKGVIERQMFRPKDGYYHPVPVPDEKDIFRRTRKFRYALIGVVNGLLPMSTTDFVSSFKGRKRTLYERAEKEYHSRQVNSSDASIKACPKGEKKEMHLGFEHFKVGEPKDSAVRIISPRSPVYNLAIGRYVKVAEKKIYSGLRKVFKVKTRVVSKGRNATEVAEDILSIHQSYKNPVWVKIDIEKMDRDFSVALLKHEDWIISNCFDPSERKEYRRLARMGYVNHCTIRLRDGFMRYWLAGRRASGDMKTGLGATLANLAILYEVRQSVKFTPYVNGDDGICCMEKEMLSLFVSIVPGIYSHYNFIVKVEGIFDTFEQIVFCQTQPVFDGTKYTMVRQFPECIDKDLCTLLPINNDKSMDRWFYDISQCGLAQSSGIPVLQEFYLMFYRFSLGKKGFNLDDSRTWLLGGSMINGMHFRQMEVTQAARYSFYLAFGITPDVQVELEEFYRNAPRPVYTDETGKNKWEPKFYLERRSV